MVDEAECAVFTQEAQVYWDGCCTDDDWYAWYDWEEETYEEHDADYQEDDDWNVANAQEDIDGTDMLLYGKGKVKGKRRRFNKKGKGKEATGVGPKPAAAATSVVAWAGVGPSPAKVDKGQGKEGEKGWKSTSGGAGTGKGWKAKGWQKGKEKGKGRKASTKPRRGFAESEHYQRRGKRRGRARQGLCRYTM